LRLLVVECRDGRLREVLIARIDEALTGRGLPPTRPRPEPGHPADAPALEDRLAALAADHDVIHLTGADARLTHARWRALNTRRETIAEGTPARESPPNQTMHAEQLVRV
jgi:hypothetical protein